MKENPRVLQAFRLAADNMPASVTTITSVTLCRFVNVSSAGMRVLVSALLPSNSWISRGKPVGSSSSPTWTLGGSSQSRV